MDLSTIIKLMQYLGGSGVLALVLWLAFTHAPKSDSQRTASQILWILGFVVGIPRMFHDLIVAIVWRFRVLWGKLRGLIARKRNNTMSKNRPLIEKSTEFEMKSSQLCLAQQLINQELDFDWSKNSAAYGRIKPL